MEVLVEFSFSKDLAFDECGSSGKYVQTRGCQLKLLTEADLEDLAILKELKITVMDDSDNDNITAKVEMKVIQDPEAINAFKLLSRFTCFQSEDIYEQLKSEIAEAIELRDLEKIVTFEETSLEKRQLEPIKPSPIQVPTELIKNLVLDEEPPETIDRMSKTWRKNVGLIHAVLNPYFKGLEKVEFRSMIDNSSGFVWTRKLNKQKIQAHFTLVTEADWDPEEYAIEYLALVQMTFSRKQKELAIYNIYLSDLAFFLRRYNEIKDFEKLDFIIQLVAYSRK